MEFPQDPQANDWVAMQNSSGDWTTKPNTHKCSCWACGMYTNNVNLIYKKSNYTMEASIKHRSGASYGTKKTISVSSTDTYSATINKWR